MNNDTSLSAESLGRSTALTPNALFLAAAGISFLLSVSLWFLVDREQGLFVGLWVPSILSLGNLLQNGRGVQR